jgi:hypothetical protein
VSFSEEFGAVVSLVVDSDSSPSVSSVSVSFSEEFGTVVSVVVDSGGEYRSRVAGVSLPT